MDAIRRAGLDIARTAMTDAPTPGELDAIDGHLATATAAVLRLRDELRRRARYGVPAVPVAAPPPKGSR